MMHIVTPKRARGGREIAQTMWWLKDHGIDALRISEDDCGDLWSPCEVLGQMYQIASTADDDAFGWIVDIPDEDDAVEFLMRFG